MNPNEKGLRVLELLKDYKPTPRETETLQKATRHVLWSAAGGIFVGSMGGLWIARYRQWTRPTYRLAMGFAGGLVGFYSGAFLGGSRAKDIILSDRESYIAQVINGAL
jgi:hypothetical protein